ncbi:unnamed protein product, partial [Phaeothamnion confervicola]
MNILAFLVAGYGRVPAAGGFGRQMELLAIGEPHGVPSRQGAGHGRADEGGEGGSSGDGNGGGIGGGSSGGDGSGGGGGEGGNGGDGDGDGRNPLVLARLSGKPSGAGAMGGAAAEGNRRTLVSMATAATRHIATLAATGEVSLVNAVT